MGIVPIDRRAKPDTPRVEAVKIAVTLAVMAVGCAAFVGCLVLCMARFAGIDIKDAF